jgi:hypothetical protein
MTSTMLVKGIGVALFASACVASCGGRTDITPASVRFADFPAQAAQAFCNNAGHCCTGAGLPFDPASCVPKVQAALEVQFNPEPGAPVTADTPIPQTCVAAIATAASQCRGWFACAELLEATQRHGTQGQPCNGTCTHVSGTLSCGGDGASNPNALPCFASDGLYCDQPSKTCQRRGTIGQPCSDGLGCENARCDPGTMLCAELLPEGSDCGHDVLGCGEGLVCELQSSILCTSVSTVGNQCTCTSTLPDGAACNDSRQCSASPCNDGMCQGGTLNLSDLQFCGG